MQSLQDLQDKLFFECKSILENVSKINTPEELLVKHDILIELTDRINILKYLDKNKEVFTSNIIEEPVSSVAEVSVTEVNHEDLIEEIANSEVEEEVLFTNELNDFDEDELLPSALNDVLEDDIPEDIEDQFVNDLVEEEFEEEDENYVDEEPNFAEEIIEEPILAIDEENMVIPDELEDQLVEDIIEEEIVFHHHEIDDEELSEINSNDVEELIDHEINDQSEELHIPEFEKPKEVDDMFAFAMGNSNENESNLVEGNNEVLVETPSQVQNVVQEVKVEESLVSETNQEKLSLQEKAEQNSEKKFKLSNIKGIKAIHSLFDDEMFENPSPTQSETLTSTIEKSKTEFRLDLNDKIAFTKMLFGGSQADLNDALRAINNCNDIEEAKEYLSDLYYDKHWSKVDDYAQRLWSLVENKFS